MKRVLRYSTDYIELRRLRQPHVLGQILIVVLRMLDILLSLTDKFGQNLREHVKLLLDRLLIPRLFTLLRIFIIRILDHSLHIFNHLVPVVQLNFQRFNPQLIALSLVILILINILGMQLFLRRQ